MTGSAGSVVSAEPRPQRPSRLEHPRRAAGTCASTTGATASWHSHSASMLALGWVPMSDSTRSGCVTSTSSPFGRPRAARRARRVARARVPCREDRPGAHLAPLGQRLRARRGRGEVAFRARASRSSRCSRTPGSGGRDEARGAGLATGAGSPRPARPAPGPTGATTEHLCARAPEEPVPARAAPQPVATPSTEEGVAAAVAQQPVVAASAADQVTPGEASDHVVPAQAGDDVAPPCPT